MESGFFFGSFDVATDLQMCVLKVYMYICIYMYMCIYKLTSCLFAWYLPLAMAFRNIYLYIYIIPVEQWVMSYIG